MSADLLAAFGIDDPNAQHGSGREKVQQRAAVSEADPFDVFEQEPNKGKQEKEITDQTKSKPPASDSNVLFDAEDFENGDDDEFGDFERVDDGISQQQPTQGSGPSSGLIDLLEAAASNQPTASNSAIDGRKPEDLDDEDEWADFTAPHSDETTPQTWVNGKIENESATHGSNTFGRREDFSAVAEAAHDEGNEALDEWDDFEDGPTSSESKKTTETAPVISQVQVIQQERPMNVPPPAVILSLLTRVVTMLASKTKTAKDDTIGISSLQVYCVTARVISGRSLRWKRDKVLAQSMRIGAAGRSGGMKLTSVDKGENRREEQETAELLNVWTANLHSLNQAMIRAKVHKPPVSLSPKLIVKTVSGPDILTATHVCPVCGLKRNERVNGIDVSISDTFGSWWIEYWGHTDCHDFWYQFNQHLDQR